MFRLIFLSAMASFAAWAQSTGAATVVGTVTDKSGAVVPGAKVTVRNLGTQFISSGQTNAAGAYYVPSLNSGTYEVAVEATGFKKFVQTGLVLRINESPRIDVQLEVGNVTESVKVDATAPLLETETAVAATAAVVVVIKLDSVGSARACNGSADAPGGSASTWS